jgi:hypothetical protein
MNTNLKVLTHSGQGCIFQVFPTNIRGVPGDTRHTTDESFLAEMTSMEPEVEL